MSTLLERSGAGLIKQYRKAVEAHGDWAPAAAQELGVDVSLFYALLVKEVGGTPARLGRSIKKLFMIRDYWTKKYRQKHPNRSLPSWASKRMDGSWSVIDQAMQLDADLTYRSTSWGLGQIHGWSARKLGYSSAKEMVKAFMGSAEAQQRGMIDFIRTKPVLHRAMKNKDWWAIGRYYNGDKRGRYAGHLRLMYNAANPNNQDNSRIATSRREYLKTGGKGGGQPGTSGAKIVLIGDSNAAWINQEYKSHYESRGADVLAIHWNGSGASQWIRVLSRVASGSAGGDKRAAAILRHGVTQIHCTSLGGNDGGRAYKDSTLKAYIDRKIKPLMQLMAKYPGSTFSGPVPVGADRMYKDMKSNVLRARMSNAMAEAASATGIAYWNPHGEYSYDTAALDKRKDNVHITARMAKKEFAAREGFLSGQAAATGGAAGTAIAQNKQDQERRDQEQAYKETAAMLQQLAQHKDAIAKAGPPTMAQVKAYMAHAKEQQNAPEPEEFGDDETPIDIPGKKGRIKKKYVKFLKTHQPDFDFDKFYGEIDTYLKNVKKKDVLASRDYVFGDEHYEAFVLVRDIKDRVHDSALAENLKSLRSLVREVKMKW